jgi:hypothetical protein
MPQDPSPVDPRFITSEFFSEHHEALASAVRAKLRTWGAHGWRVSGQGPAMRVEVVVPTTHQRPRQPIAALEIGGRLVKPNVIASHAHIRREMRTTGEGSSAIGLSRAIAPGARVRVGRGDGQEFVGIAAVLDFPSGDTRILTCGHARAFSFSSEILPSDDPQGDTLANLDRNFLSENPPLDAAICTLTDAGKNVLASSSGAPTWRFQNIRTPGAADNGHQAVFWQTHDGDDTAPTAPVETFSGENLALFGPGGPASGFVETSHVVVPGDSGSLLSLGQSLYGLCSGFVGFTAFFTPIASVIARLQSEGTSCTVHRPS